MTKEKQLIVNAMRDLKMDIIDHIDNCYRGLPTEAQEIEDNFYVIDQFVTNQLFPNNEKP